MAPTSAVAPAAAADAADATDAADAANAVDAADPANTALAADAADAAQLCVLMAPGAVGGHEVALLGWLADAVREHGLRPAIVAPGSAQAAACVVAGLGGWLLLPLPPLQPAAAAGLRQRLQLLLAMARWPATRPLLLTPGVLHANAWLLAAAVALRRRVWVYVPMTNSAASLGWRGGRLRDRALAPWLQRVQAWITPDARQAAQLRHGWGVTAPVHELPNIARLAAGPPPPAPAPAPDGRLRVAYVGRFHAPQKGLDWVAALLLREPVWTQHFQWCFQGSGPAELTLLELACTLGPQHVQVHRWAPLDHALAVSDVLLLPSRYEGLPLVALEATQRGWPVVASRQSNLGDILPAASVFDFGDAAGMHRALAGLAAAGARAAAVAHARARVAALHPPQRYRLALHSMVGALAASAATGAGP